jgi:hypothetical protein
MTSKLLLRAGLCAALCAGCVSMATAAPPNTAATATTVPNPITMPKGITDRIRPAAVCAPDLTITRIALTRSGPTRSVVRVSVEVRNIGTGSFVSDPRQAGVSALLTNGNTNGRVTLNLGSISQIRSGATQVLTDISADMPFDTFEFGGEVQASINYDPDILLDGQPCNDDRVYPNNAFSISNDRIRAWLATPSNSLIVPR